VALGTYARWPFLLGANFSELRKGEVRRIYLLGGWVNKGKKSKGGPECFAPALPS
jgi:hypothetical protein